MKIGVILEARIESTRLPGKILLPLNFDSHNFYGIPEFLYLIDRINYSKKINQIIMACPDTDPNYVIDEILDQCEDTSFIHPINTYHGPMDDVLRRTLLAAKKFEIDTIVSITCDCPLVDPHHIDLMIDQYFTDWNLYKYHSNIHPRTWPDGLDIQIYSSFLLELVDRIVPDLDTRIPYRHHSGWNIYNYKNQIGNLLGKEIMITNYPAPNKYHWPELGLTLDEYDDYRLINIILNKFIESNIEIEKIIDWLRKNPRLICNRKIKRKMPGEG